MSIVTQPDSSSAPTSPLPAISSSVLKPCVHDPTEQLPWSSATVENVVSTDSIQNTQPAATRPAGAGPTIKEWIGDQWINHQ